MTPLICSDLGCGKLDVIFLYEDSNILTSAQFDDQIKFFISIASSLSVGENEANIGIVKASGRYNLGEIVLNLTTYLTSEEIIWTLGNLTYSGVYGEYQYYYGMNAAYEYLMRTKRRDSQGVVVTVTADMLLNYEPQHEVVPIARHNGTKLIAVGLNVNVTSQVTDPSYAFNVNDSKAFPSKAPDVVTAICPGKRVAL